MSILGVIGLAGRRTRARQLSEGALVGYFHSTSAAICSGSAGSQTVYNSTYSTLSDVYLNSAPIFSDPGLTTSASIGFSTGFGTCVSGDKFRLNFTALNATHANFSISMNLDSVN